jgi:hypothetical protein
VRDDENNGVQRHKLDGTCLDFRIEPALRRIT